MIKSCILFIIIIVLFCQTPVFAAFESEHVSARLMGMGNVYVAICDDINSSFVNPAGLDRLYGMSFSSGYTKLFDMDELMKGQAAYSVATNLGGLGVTFTNFGDEIYGERSASVAYGKQVIERLYAGTRVNWHGLEIENYGSQSIFSFDVGILAFADDNIRLGAFAQKLNQPKVTDDKNDKLEPSLLIGAAYIRDKFILAVDVYKEANFEKEYRMGIEYQVFPQLTLRAGSQTEPSRYSGGLTLRYSHFNFDYAYVNHTVLRGTHYFSLTMKWGNK